MIMYANHNVKQVILLNHLKINNVYKVAQIIINSIIKIITQFVLMQVIVNINIMIKVTLKNV